jgi:hypothetical protein
VLTIFVGVIAVVLLGCLLMRSSLIRKCVAVFLGALLIAYIIRDNGGDSTYWMPWIVGTLMCIAAVSWIVEQFQPQE